MMTPIAEGQYRISQGYNAHRGDSYPFWGGYHKGIDYACNVGTSIIAVEDADVICARLNGEWGLLVVFIGTKTGRTVFHAHCSSLRVQEGQQVKRGQVIALSGGAKGAPGSGNSTGPHLHYGVSSRQSVSQTAADWVDPEDYLRQVDKIYSQTNDNDMPAPKDLYQSSDDGSLWFCKEVKVKNAQGAVIATEQRRWPWNMPTDPVLKKQLDDMIGGLLEFAAECKSDGHYLPTAEIARRFPVLCKVRSELYR